MRQILILFIVTVVLSQAKFNCNYLEEDGKIVYLELRVKNDFINLDEYYAVNKEKFNLKIIFINNLYKDLNKFKVRDYNFYTILLDQAKNLKSFKFNGNIERNSILNINDVISALKESNLEEFIWSNAGKLSFKELNDHEEVNEHFFGNLTKLSFEGTNLISSSTNSFKLDKYKFENLHTLNIKSTDIGNRKFITSVNNVEHFPKLNKIYASFSDLLIFSKIENYKIKSISTYNHNNYEMGSDFKKLKNDTNFIKLLKNLDNFYIDTSKDQTKQSFFSISDNNFFDINNSKALSNLLNTIESNIKSGYFSRLSNDKLSPIICNSEDLKQYLIINYNFNNEISFFSNANSKLSVSNHIEINKTKRADLISIDYSSKEILNLINRFNNTQFVFVTPLYNFGINDSFNPYNRDMFFNRPQFNISIPKF